MSSTHFEQVPLETVEERIAKGEILEMTTNDDDDFESPLETEPTDSDGLRYPKWQMLVQEALLELDKNRLKERLILAEKAIADRRRSISQEPDAHVEQQALEDALA